MFDCNAYRKHRQYLFLFIVTDKQRNSFQTTIDKLNQETARENIILEGCICIYLWKNVIIINVFKTLHLLAFDKLIKSPISLVKELLTFLQD